MLNSLILYVLFKYRYINFNVQGTYYNCLFWYPFM